MWQEAHRGTARLWLQKDTEQRDSWQNEPEPPEWAGDVQAQWLNVIWQNSCLGWWLYSEKREDVSCNPYFSNSFLKRHVVAYFHSPLHPYSRSID